MSSEVLDRAFIKGLNLAFTDDKNQSIKNEILQHFPEMVKDNLAELPVEVQKSVCDGVLNQRPEELNEGFFKDFINKSILTYKNKDYSNQSNTDMKKWAEWFYYLHIIKSAHNTIDWYSVLETISNIQSKTSSDTISSFHLVLDRAISQNKVNLTKIVYKTDIKSYPKSLKSKLYSRVIKEGNLDLKIARRIRSDSNGSLSSELIKVIFESRKKYTDEVFQELITQFSDTKHKWVAQYIALNMPAHLIPFLIGLEDETAMKIIEKRMTHS